MFIKQKYILRKDIYTLKNWFLTIDVDGKGNFYPYYKKDKNDLFCMECNKMHTHAKHEYDSSITPKENIDKCITLHFNDIEKYSFSVNIIKKLIIEKDSISELQIISDFFKKFPRAKSEGYYVYAKRIQKEIHEHYYKGVKCVQE